MFKRIKIEVAGNILGALILTLGVSYYFLIDNIQTELVHVDTAWQEYQVSKSEKARLESLLRSTIGFGGIIHQFTNLELRKDISNLEELQSKIGAAQLLIEQYRSLDISGAETIALSDIEQVLKSYNNAATTISRMIQQGDISPEEIDAAVRIDDAPAFRGLEILVSEVYEDSVKHQNLKSFSNSRLVTLLKAYIGYGGVIHHFNNFLLRREPYLIPEFTVSLNNANNIIGEYQSRDISNTEKIALHDISEALSNYELAFQQAEELGLSAEETDQFVRVDDGAALRSFALLDKEVVAFTERSASEVQQTLKVIRADMNLSLILGLSIAVFVVLIALFTIRRLILLPIARLTREMMELATGKTEFKVSGVNFKNEIGNMARAVVVFQENLIKLKLAEESVRELALTDPLTGLANRSHFDQRLKETIVLVKRLKTGAALLAIDLDGFKAINDTHGHAAGDHVLKIISDRFCNSSREVDIVARMGGDEFCIIAVAVEEPHQIATLASRIISEASRPVLFEEVKLNVTASIGVSFIPQQGDSVEDLSQKADMALYRAKEKGKNQCVLYEDTDKEESPEAEGNPAG